METNNLVKMVLVTQYLLCMVSMCLTGLFCLTFVGNSPAVLNLLSTAAMVVVGVGLDLCKYLFWHWRSQSAGYLLNSLFLVVFSWSASLAFFVTHEKNNVDTVRTKTAEYTTHKAEISHLNEQIRLKSALVKKRMESSYHAQWDKAETLLQDIQELEAEVQRHMNRMKTVGQTSAQQSVATSALFLTVSTLLSVSVSQVAVVAYGILAFLIECCSLGAISLSQYVLKGRKRKPVVKRGPRDRKRVEAVSGSPIIDEKMEKLRRDIVSGKIEPVLRRIKRSGYRLSESNIRAVLTALKEQGILVDGPRNLILSENT